MKTKLFFYALFVVGLVAACSDNNNESSVDEAEVELASEILGAAVGDESGGVIASLYDATSTVSTEGFSEPNFMLQKGIEDQTSNRENPNSGRGTERNRTYTYNPETGEHISTFERIVNLPSVKHSVSLRTAHIFTDQADNFVQFPRRQGFSDVSYEGTRQGYHKARRGSRNFNRAGAYFASGFDESASKITLEGSFSGTSTDTVTTLEGRTFVRNATYSFELVDVVIDKTLLNDGLEKATTGTINFALQTERVSEERRQIVLDVSGTIDIATDGFGRLRFTQFSRSFLVNLVTGETQQDS